MTMRPLILLVAAALVLPSSLHAWGGYYYGPGWRPGGVVRATAGLTGAVVGGVLGGVARAVTPGPVAYYPRYRGYYGGGFRSGYVGFGPGPRVVEPGPFAGPRFGYYRRW